MNAAIHAHTGRRRPTPILRREGWTPAPARAGAADDAPIPAWAVTPAGPAPPRSA